VPVAGNSTRSEVCHLADAVERGFAGCVLSNETAVSPALHAAAAVRLVRQITAAATDDAVAASPFAEWWHEARAADPHMAVRLSPRT